jgi:hypothetical protein
MGGHAPPAAMELISSKDELGKASRDGAVRWGGDRASKTRPAMQHATKQPLRTTPSGL